MDNHIMNFEFDSHYLFIVNIDLFNIFNDVKDFICLNSNLIFIKLNFYARIKLIKLYYLSFILFVISSIHFN
jgi:hypothetical protein